MGKPLLICVPIYNLVISDDIGGEIKIENVTFVSKEKLPRIRKRLGIPKRISAYHNRYKKNWDSFLNSSNTFAVLYREDFNKDNYNFEFNEIRDAVYILNSSQFNSNREWRIMIGFPEYGNYNYTNIKDETKGTKALDINLIILDDKIKTFKLYVYSPIHEFRFDKFWINIKKHHFFPFLKKILNDKVKVSSDWKREIKTASVLAGQSYYSTTIWEAFMLVWIAVDMLLTKRDEYDKTQKIKNRLFYLFGWIIKNKRNIWYDIIEKLAEKRNNLMHGGQRKNINYSDLRFMDTILTNLLRTICTLTDVYKCKEDIINLTKEFNKNGKPRPKHLKFLQPHVSKEDRKRSQYQSLWDFANHQYYSDFKNNEGE